MELLFIILPTCYFSVLLLNDVSLHLFKKALFSSLQADVIFKNIACDCKGQMYSLGVFLADHFQKLRKFGLFEKEVSIVNSFFFL